MCDVEKFLFLVKTRPAIYNFKLKEHSDKRIVDKLWSEIAEEMQLSVRECKAKYTSLRNSYSRFLREQPPPGAVKNKKKKTWYLAAAMSFLKDHMMIHRKSDIIDDSRSLINEIKDGDDSLDYTPSSSGSRKRKSTATDQMAEPMIEYFMPKLHRNETEDPNLLFFMSVLPDMKKLTDKNQRQVKQDFLFNLNKLLEEQDIKSSPINTLTDY